MKTAIIPGQRDIDRIVRGQYRDAMDGDQSVSNAKDSTVERDAATKKISPSLQNQDSAVGLRRLTQQDHWPNWPVVKIT